MKRWKMIVVIIAVSILLTPTYMAKGEKMPVEKVRLDPEFVKIASNVTYLGINASLPVKIGYESGGDMHVLESENLEVWKDGGKWKEKPRFWEKKDDGYYVEGIRVTGESITGGEKRGEEWIVTTGTHIYWYDGSLHSDTIKGKVAVGMRFYAAYIDGGILKIKNLTSGMEEEIGRAKLYDIATDSLGYLHVVWWDGKVIKYRNEVPGFWYLLDELDKDGVKESEKIGEYAKSGEWVKAIRIVNQTLENLRGDKYYEMEYVKMYIWFEIEDPAIWDTGTYEVNVIKKNVRWYYTEFHYEWDENTHSKRVVTENGTADGYEVEVKNVVYTMPKLKAPTNLGNIVKIKMRLSEESGNGDAEVYVNGIKVRKISDGKNEFSVRRAYFYENSENAITVKSNYKEEVYGKPHGELGEHIVIKGEKVLSQSYLYRAKVSIEDATIGGVSLIGDPDRDGLHTVEEWAIGTDPNNSDTDGDGMPDGWEYKYGLNPTNSGDKNGDPDGDGLKNYEEYENNLNPRNPDWDSDGLKDGTEVHGWNEDVNGKTVKFTSNPKSKDSDGDGLSDLQEYENRTNPKSSDTDGDSLPDVWELCYGLNANSNSGKDGKNGDYDGDYVSNYEEYKHGTDPTNPDTDGDGVSDGDEIDGISYYVVDASGNKYWKVAYNSDPLNPDTDGDGLSDGQEMNMQLNPTSKDTDGDGLTDGNEVYTRVYEYPYRKYIDGSTKLWLKWKEDYYSLGIKDAKVLVGIRAKSGKSISMNVYYGNNKLGGKSTGSMGYISASLMKYVGKSDRYVRLELSGHGWVESFKVMLVEESDPHNKDTDRDGLSDGYEVLGKSGYITSPVSNDTDADGISDYWEIKGWSWNYNTEKKYRNNNGFHTNPLSKDTDGDGYPDNEDANPLANLVLKMEVVKYHHDSRTVFVGFKANYSYNEEEKNVQYYTEHKDTEIDNYVYYFDIPDKIGVNVYVEWAAYYTKAWWEGSGDSQEWYDSTTQKVGSIGKTWNIWDGTIQIAIKEIGLKRIHTVGVYNGSSFINGRYSYKGKFYVLYVQSTESYGPINKGLNVIVVPDAMFVNSQLYKKIQDGNVSCLQGTDSDNAKIGAIDEKTMGVHIVGMFFFKTDKQNLKNLLSLLVKNLSDLQFAHYSAITSEQANLPVDILKAIPLQSIHNSPTGEEPKDTWGYISSAVTGAAVAVANFVYNAIVGLANLLEKAATIVAQFAMKLWDTAVNAVKTAVEVIKKVVDTMVQGLINLAKEILNTIVKPIKNAINNFIEMVKGIAYAIKELIVNGEGTLKLLSDIFSSKIFNTLTLLPMIIGTIYGVITASSMGIGAIVMQFLPGLVGNVIVHSLVSNINTLSITTPYASDTSELGIGTLHLLLNAGSIKTIDKGMGLLGFGATMIGMYISYVAYKSAMNRLKDAIILAKKINSIYGQGQVSLDTFFASINQLAEAYKELGGVIGEFSDENINNEFGNLGTKLRAVTYISLIVGGISLVISAIPFFVNMPGDIKVMLEGLGLGLASYSLYKSIVNKITIPGLPTTLSNIGLVLNGISVGAGAYGFARELSG